MSKKANPNSSNEFVTEKGELVYSQLINELVKIESEDKLVNWLVDNSQELSLKEKIWLAYKTGLNIEKMKVLSFLKMVNNL